MDISFPRVQQREPSLSRVFVAVDISVYFCVGLVPQRFWQQVEVAFLCAKDRSEIQFDRITQFGKNFSIVFKRCGLLYELLVVCDVSWRLPLRCLSICATLKLSRLNLMRR